MSSRESPSLTWMGWGKQEGFHGGSGFYSSNEPLIPCPFPGPVMGPGASGKWKVLDSMTSCPVPREACVDLETLMTGSIQAARNAPSRSKLLSSVLDAVHGNRSQRSSLSEV